MLTSVLLLKFHFFCIMNELITFATKNYYYFLQLNKTLAQNLNKQNYLGTNSSLSAFKMLFSASEVALASTKCQ